MHELHQPSPLIQPWKYSFTSTISLYKCSSFPLIDKLPLTFEHTIVFGFFPFSSLPSNLRRLRVHSYDSLLHPAIPPPLFIPRTTIQYEAFIYPPRDYSRLQRHTVSPIILFRPLLVWSSTYTICLGSSSSTLPREQSTGASTIPRFNTDLRVPSYRQPFFDKLHL